MNSLRSVGILLWKIGAVEEAHRAWQLGRVTRAELQSILSAQKLRAHAGIVRLHSLCIETSGQDAVEDR